MHDLEVIVIRERLCQNRHEGTVQLDRYDLIRALAQLRRQAPMPGPTSIALPHSAAPLISAMRRGTLSSVRKFCPSDLEKWNP